MHLTVPEILVAWKAAKGASSLVGFLEKSERFIPHEERYGALEKSHEVPFCTLASLEIAP